ncbi:MAG: hypothetical protein ACI865_002206 [Flavobacteriaceae bacterium]|jgi:hypothetical protein
MKKYSLIPKVLFFLPILFVAFSFVENSAPIDLNLKQAISSKKINAEIISNGKYSGKSVLLKITNNTSSSINVKIPAGSAYMPADDGEQTLVQLEEEFIALAPKATQNITVAAFCSESSDGCPSDDSAFALSATTDKKLNQMIAYMKGKNISKMAYQDAVWAITDGKSISNIQATDKVTKDFREFVAKLMGKENTWYTSPQKYTVDSRGNINSATVVISGNLKFPSDGITPIHEEVFDADGNMLYRTNAAQPRKSANVTMEFSIRVKGWEMGTYVVKVMEGDKELKSFPFEV